MKVGLIGNPENWAGDDNLPQQDEGLHAVPGLRDGRPADGSRHHPHNLPAGRADSGRADESGHNGHLLLHLDRPPGQHRRAEPGEQPCRQFIGAI